MRSSRDMVAKSQAHNGAPKKKPGGAAGFFFLLLLIGGGVAALHFTGKLQPLLDSFGKKDGPPPAAVVPAPAETTPEPVEAIPEPVKPEKKVVEKTPEKKPEPVKKVDVENALSSAYRKRFNAPKVGQPITLMLKGRVKKTGVLKHLDEKTIRINTGKIDMTLTRDQLAAAGLARCYEDDYVRYMVALHKQKEQAEKLQQQRLAKLNDAYAQFMKSRGKKVGKSTTYTAKQSIDDVDFKKWMEENGQTDLLKARQERIKAYETKRMKAGREY